MSLTRVTFTSESLPLLAAFDCAKDENDEFGRIATDWIKCVDPKDSAIGSMLLGTSVFLYIHTDGNGLETVAGFGSIGTNTRTVKGKQELWSIIPHFGVDKLFRGYPPDCEWFDRYSAQIMLNLMNAAEQMMTPTLYLMVHPKNDGALKLYHRLNFQEFGQQTPKGYLKMMIDLPLPPNFHDEFASYIV